MNPEIQTSDLDFSLTYWLPSAWEGGLGGMSGKVDRREGATEHRDVDGRGWVVGGEKEDRWRSRISSHQRVTLSMASH